MAFIRALLSSQLSFTEKYHELNLSLTILTWWWWLFVFWHFLIEFFKGKLSFKLWEKVQSNHFRSWCIREDLRFEVFSDQLSICLGSTESYNFDHVSSSLESRYVSTECRCLPIRFSLRFVLTLDRNKL